MRRGLAALTAAGVLLLTACGAGTADESGTATPSVKATPAVTAPPTLSRASDPPHDVVVTVPAEFAQRRALPSCGTYDGRLEPPGDEPNPSDAPWACLRRAVGSAEGAELAVVYSSVEGDLIKEYVRALPGGGVEVFADQTRDKFGTRVWTRTTCSGIASGERVRPSGCEEPVEYLARPLAGVTWFLRTDDDGPHYNITFDEDGTWTSEDECRVRRGTYTVDHIGALTFTASGAAPSAKCDPEGAQRAFQRAPRVVVTPDQLMVLDTDGNAVAWYDPLVAL